VRRPPRARGVIGHARLFSQIVIGIIVTVVGTVIANALVGSGRGGSHFMSGVHMSGPGRR